MWMLRFLPLVLVAMAGGLYGLSPLEILQTADDRRYFPEMFFDVDIVSYDEEGSPSSLSLSAFIKADKAKVKSLFFFTGPEDLYGRKMLIDGKVVYLLFPKTRNPIRLTPLQVLLGEASNGDVASTGFSHVYDPADMVEATWKGGACYRFSLVLKPGMKDTGYEKVTLYVDRQNYRLVYSEFRTKDDLLVKRIHYSQYETHEGKSIPTFLDIYEGESQVGHTTLAYRNIRKRPIADSAFRREYLEIWAPRL